MTIEESILLIGPTGSEMLGVFAAPAAMPATGALGVVIVVGGPQTRVGSHRQFVLLARALAAAGYPCLRFDYTGMGDSPGPRPDFEKAGPDIRRACDALQGAMPHCRRIVLWGLCDGASAALLYASSDERIAGVVAANPWARSEATRSAAIVRDHYSGRLRSPEFWRRLLSGKVNVLASAREALGHARAARRAGAASDEGPPSLPLRLARVLANATVPVRLQLSGSDLTASEFEIAMKGSGVVGWQGMSIAAFESADHTFSVDPAWARAIEDTLGFVESVRVRRSVVTR